MMLTKDDKARLKDLAMQGSSFEPAKKTKQELWELIREMSDLVRGLLRDFDREVNAKAKVKVERLEKEIASQKRELDRIIEARIQLEKELEEAKTHSENWGGKRPGAGRKPTGIKRFSRKVNCTSRMAAAFAEYGRQLGQTPLEKILKQQKLEEKWDRKDRFLYLSKEEWDVVKPVYKKY